MLKLSVLILTLLVTNCLTETSLGTSSGPSSSSDSTTVSSSSADTTVSPTLSSTTPSKPPTTTVVPTTSSLIPTSPTIPTSTSPETTTLEPTSSTEPPTTTTTTSITTTSMSSTTVLPSTTSAPLTTTPIPVPEEGNWNVTSGNTTCIRADLKVLFKISLENEVYYLALSPNASSDNSNCNGPNGTQELVLTDSAYVLGFIFEKDSTNVYVRNISFIYRVPGGSDTVTNDTRLFSVKSGNSYLCTASSDVILGNVTMEISKIRIQAFGSANNKDFGADEECDADNPVNDIVPIAVGVALLALVVAVLIAYLVGRRKNRQKGYQSV